MTRLILKVEVDQEEPETEPDEEVLVIVEPEEPETEPDAEEELVLSQELPETTPETGGTLMAIVALGALLAGSGVLLRKFKGE